MAYIVPRVLINQEFTQSPVFADNPLAALIVGPQYNLYRYSVSDEKASTKVVHPLDESLSNVYQYLEDITYDLPNQQSDTKVDADFVKVFFEKAEVEYFPNDLASTSAAVVRTAVPNSSKWYTNRVKASSLVFKTANNVNRSADFSLRDVAPGDVVVLRSPGLNVNVTTKVKALHASKSAAVIGTEVADSANADDQTQDINDAVEYGDNNTGLTTGIINDTTGFKGGWTGAGVWVGEETFTATVTTAYTSSLADLRFTLTSENGLIAETTGVALATVTSDADVLVFYTDAAGGKVRMDFTGLTNGDVGDTYSVTVFADYDHDYAPVATGTFTGTTDTVYKLTVVRGGKFYDGSTNAATCARVAVTSTGTDSSATVSPIVATDFTVGSYGVVAQFANQASAYGGLVLGDVYHIPVSAPAAASTNILEVYDTLPTTLSGGGTTDWVISSLRLVKDYQVLQAIPDNDADTNWEVIDQTILIQNGITTADAKIVDDNYEPINLDVVKANIFVEHRDLVVTNALSIGSLNDPALVNDTLGTVHPDNPLAQGVYDALLNSGGVSVYFGGVQTDDLEGYENTLSLARKSELYYSVVPLSFDTAIHDAVVGHVNAMSTSEVAKWRVAWISVPLKTSQLIYETKVDNADWTGTLTDDSLTADVSPPIYTLLTVAGATFITDEVRPLDEVRINFRTNSFGEVLYDTYNVSAVRTETTLVISNGPTAPINVAAKVQIARVFTKDEQIDNLSLVGSEYNNRRVRAVFPSSAKLGDVVKPGYILAAALAGLRSSVVPHQGLTNSPVLGFSDLTDVVTTFSDDQQNRLAEQGYWIVTQAAVGATPYVRHQLTTDASSLNTSEDSVTTNVDSISYGLMNALAPYIGKYNINRTSVALIRAAIFNELKFRQTNTYTVRAGNQLLSFEIVSLAQNPTFKDRIDATITLQVPYPMNFVTVTLVV